MKLNINTFKIALANNKLTLEQLALKSEVSRYTLTRANKGLSISPIIIGKISDALGVSVNELVKDEQ